MYRDCTIRVAKTKALISFAVTAKLICVFVFAYAKWWFCQNEAHIAWLSVSALLFRFHYSDVFVDIGTNCWQNNALR